MTNGSHATPAPLFPTHNAPRVWLLTSGDSPIGIALAKQVLAHGDYVVSGIIPADFERDGGRSDEFQNFLAEAGRRRKEGWKARLRIVALDVRMMGQCQAAIAQAVHAFGRIDILLCCTSQAIIGTVEELAVSQRTQSLVRDQFETNFFGPMNIIRAVLPSMRDKSNGHMIVLGGITGHIGTPGLGMYCAAGWALEGFCDSIAYEVAPFNIKMTVVQASIEIGILTNKITSVPPLPSYSSTENHAPLFRGILDRLLNRLPGIQSQYPAAAAAAAPSPSPSDIDSSSSTPPPPPPPLATHSPHPPPASSPSPSHPSSTPDSSPSPTASLSSPSLSSPTNRQHSSDHHDHHPQRSGPSILSRPEVVTLYPPLSPAHTALLIAETVHCLTAIAGHENPPARHIVGVEGVAAVKEKLKTVSEELEDFVDASTAVDVDKVPAAATAVRQPAHEPRPSSQSLGQAQAPGQGQLFQRSHGGGVGGDSGGGGAATAASAAAAKAGGGDGPVDFGPASN